MAEPTSPRDSLDVRKALIARMEKGELTLEQVQREVRRLKREAHRHGELTMHEQIRERRRARR